VRVLDLVGGFGAGLFGHNHPELKATLRHELDQDRPFLAQCALRNRAGELGRRLSDLLPGASRYLSHFTNDGAGAVEAALKHAYKVRFDLLRRRFDAISRDIESFHREHERDPAAIELPGSRELGRFRDDLDEHNIAELERFQHRPVVLALKGAFHGKTTGALKLTFNRTYREAFEGLSAVRTIFVDVADLHRLEEIVAPHAIEFRVPVLEGRRVTIESVRCSTVILLALEAIQGEGGIRPVPDAALAAVAGSLQTLAIPCLVDEIQTGCGRTGSFVGYATTPLAAIEPEYVTLSKALGGGLAKIGAVLIREDVYDPDFGVLHTSTFAEDEISCAVALRALDLLVANDGEMLQRVRQTGAYLLDGLGALARRYPGIVREVRGRGLMIGIELDELDDRSPLFRFGIRQGFLPLLIASYLLEHHQIRLLAPLTTLLKGNPGRKRQAILRIQPAVVITQAECDRIIDALAEVFEIIARNNEGVLIGHLVGTSPDEAQRRDPPRVMVERPLIERRADFDARVGFIVHPARVNQLIEYYLPSLRGTVEPRTVAAWWSRLARFLEPDVVHTEYIASADFTVEVSIVAVPYLPHQLVETRACELQDIRDKIQDAVTVARELGDDHIPTSLVGLGAYTSIVTDQGRTINDFEVPITTGNAYTAGLMLQGIAHAADLRGIALADARVAVVGAAGNIGSVLAELLAGEVASLALVGRPGSTERLERTRSTCLAHAPDAADRITLHTSVEAVREADVVLVATSSPEGRLIGPDTVKPGAIISCASVPSNLSAAFRDRLDDFLVFDGGFARLPEGQEIDCVGLPAGGLAFGCLSETLLLAFDGHERSFARGCLTREQVEYTLTLAERHGFTLGELKLDGRPHPIGVTT
jgi:acetylornithine/succinyldiaminopimelate/putrescine aminotransferase/predicted amino acid dehydrogenase